MRRFKNGMLVLATHNPGKLKEFRDLLGPYVEKIVSAGELGLPEPEETGKTFLENALIKSTAAVRASGHAALADDGGLCVTALGGRPGVQSARWAGPDRDFNVAMRRIHDELDTAPDRSAYFMCVLALVWPDGRAKVVEGRCDGVIVWPPRGSKGLGYDSVFVPDGHERTFAEMDAKEKHLLSHRGKASKVLVEKFFAA
jgi:XTP/dITP diphosphohydrolase